MRRVTCVRPPHGIRAANAPPTLILRSHDEPPTHFAGRAMPAPFSLSRKHHSLFRGVADEDAHEQKLNAKTPWKLLLPSPPIFFLGGEGQGEGAVKLQ